MKELDAKVNNLGQSDEEIIAEVKKSVDASLPEDKKGKWSANIQRDIYGKLISVNVNLPDSVTENEKAKAIDAINRNRGVAEARSYPFTLMEQDMESLAVGTKILPDFYVYSGDGVVEGITEDEAKSGVKSFGGVLSVARESIFHAYDLPRPTLKNLLLEYWVKCPSGIETEGKFLVKTSQAPIYMQIRKNDTWTEVAPQFGTEREIKSLIVYNGKLYGGTTTYPYGLLLEWNGVDAWVEKASRIGEDCSIASMVVYNNKLYGGTSRYGKLLEWNGVDAWVEVAGRVGVENNIYSMVVYNGKLYGCTGSHGKLLEWNGTDAWVEKASQIGYVRNVYSLAVYNNKIYGGTSNGTLWEWNGTNAWVEVAPRLNIGDSRIKSLVVYNGKLYGGTYTGGRLYEWNGTNAWVQVADTLVGTREITSLAVYNNKIYGGTSPYGRLYEWNGTNRWAEVVGQLGYLIPIHSLAVFNNKLYGGSSPDGELYEWSPSFQFTIPDINVPGTTLKLDIPDKTKWYKTTIEIVGDNYARIEVQDDLANVILSSEGSQIIHSGAKNSIVISYHRYIGTNPFLIYFDDLKISQTAR